MRRTKPTAIEPIRLAELSDLRDVAYRHLREGIVEGKLYGGMRINEREVAMLLGISTTPVKDALRRLEAEGAIVTLPRRGTFIAHFTPARLREFTLVRAALEGVAARLAAERASGGAQAAGIAAALDEMRSRTEAGDIPGLALANERFHDEVRRIADSEYLARLLDSLRVYDQATRHKILAGEEERESALSEHTVVANAILEGDGDTAEQAMREHVLRSSRAATTPNVKNSGRRGRS